MDRTSKFVEKQVKAAEKRLREEYPEIEEIAKLPRGLDWAAAVDELLSKSSPQPQDAEKIQSQLMEENRLRLNAEMQVADLEVSLASAQQEIAELRSKPAPDLLTTQFRIEILNKKLLEEEGLRVEETKRAASLEKELNATRQALSDARKEIEELQRKDKIDSDFSLITAARAAGSSLPVHLATPVKKEAVGAL